MQLPLQECKKASFNLCVSSDSYICFLNFLIFYFCCFFALHLTEKFDSARNENFDIFLFRMFSFKDTGGTFPVKIKVKQNV
jgi:hypothetical protein